MNPQKYLTRAAALVEDDLLPDVCTIQTVTGRTRDANGAIVDVWTSRTYNASANIPCRLDNSRSFRPEKLPNQAINANEYILVLPRTLVVKPNDRIKVTVGGVEHLFELRKLTSLSNWRLVNTALIAELEGQYD